MSTKRLLYRKKDFNPLPVKLEHMGICLSFFENRVEGSNTLFMTALESLQDIRLDARDLEIRSIEMTTPLSSRLSFRYLRKKNALVVKMPRLIEPGDVFSIRIKAACFPSDTILEGIYRDTTPPGCPQQFMSQCQQWGFQRILPVLDDCTAKCTMVTTMEADSRYTHMISNGNVCKARNPDGKPAAKCGDPSRRVITCENLIPMAPYLFIACVGTWDELVDHFVNASRRQVQLSYLLPKGRKDGARLPMSILKDAASWQAKTQDYDYVRDVYRTICMEKSNFGGMENVGNTTIVTDAALIDDFTSDSRLHYAHGVIVHEFEHNQCGSDVTMETPFDMWLNEAFTVDVERQYLANRFDPDCQRLDEVDSMRAPIGGPLVVEDAGHLGRIVRTGFNHPDELVDGVTYVKAAEVIRMLRLVLGNETFRKAKNLYFSRYKGANANTDQFLACFEEVSGKDLSQFKKEWLHTIGYPKVTASVRYSRKSRKLKVSFRQKRQGKGGLFHIPVEMAAVDENGRDIPETVRIAEITGRKLDIATENVPCPAFVSFNRNCSFYGTFKDLSATRDQLVSQVKLDPNRFNRVEAMRTLTDVERIRLITDINAEISENWLKIFEYILKDDSLPAGFKAYLLRIDEQTTNRDYLPFYRERYAARSKILKTLATRLGGEIRRVFFGIDTYTRDKQPGDGIDKRRLKSVLLRTLVEADTPEVQRIAEEHFRQAWNITDKAAAAGCLNMTGSSNRRIILDEALHAWKTNISGYTTYLSLTGSRPQEDVFDMITLEEKRAEFNILHPAHSRSLFLPLANNNKMLWTERGLSWLADTVIKLAPINEMSTIRLVASLQLVDKMADDLKSMTIKSLEKMRSGVDAKKSPSVAGRIDAYLSGVGK